jgi:hypothetical protein
MQAWYVRVCCACDPPLLGGDALLIVLELGWLTSALLGSTTEVASPLYLAHTKPESINVPACVNGTTPRNRNA